MTVALSFTGTVFGMQQMVVKPPAAAARAAGFDGFGVLDARLTQMNVHVDEARGDDQSRGIEFGRAAPRADLAKRPSTIAISRDAIEARCRIDARGHFE